MIVKILSAIGAGFLGLIIASVALQAADAYHSPMIPSVIALICGAIGWKFASKTSK